MASSTCFRAELGVELSQLKTMSSCDEVAGAPETVSRGSAFGAGRSARRSRPECAAALAQLVV